MPDHYFISYSSVDGADFALRLTDDLQSGPPPFSAWLDKRQLELRNHLGRLDSPEGLLAEASQAAAGGGIP